MEEKMAFKRRRNIERATLYRVEYLGPIRDEKRFGYRDFKSVKSLNQWADRNDNDDIFSILIVKKLALIDEIWEPFTTIGKKTVMLGELVNIIEELKLSFCEK